MSSLSIKGEIFTLREAEGGGERLRISLTSLKIPKTPSGYSSLISFPLIAGLED